MNTTKEIFNALYPEKEIISDIKKLERKYNEDNLIDRISYSVSDEYDKFINSICINISLKAFSLGFSTATKLTAEAFVKAENTNKNPNDYL